MTYQLELEGKFVVVDEEGEPTGEEISKDTLSELFGRLANHIYHENHDEDCDDGCECDWGMSLHGDLLIATLYMEEKDGEAEGEDSD